jgi:hypothetical protein
VKYEGIIMATRVSDIDEFAAALKNYQIINIDVK